MLEVQGLKMLQFKPWIFQFGKAIVFEKVNKDVERVRRVISQKRKRETEIASWRKSVEIKCNTRAIVSLFALLKVSQLYL